jgi:type II secretory pathway pseudopilin PulG
MEGILSYVGLAVIIILGATVVVLLLKKQAGSRKAAEAEEQARAILGDRKSTRLNSSHDYRLL